MQAPLLGIGWKERLFKIFTLKGKQRRNVWRHRAKILTSKKPGEWEKGILLQDVGMKLAQNMRHHISGQSYSKLQNKEKTNWQSFQWWKTGNRLKKGNVVLLKHTYAYQRYGSKCLALQKKCIYMHKFIVNFTRNKCLITLITIYLAKKLLTSLTYELRSDVRTSKSLDP